MDQPDSPPQPPALVERSDRIPIPRIDGNWWRIAVPPTLERWHRPGIETVDFTIYQAADGTWQLVSCIRGTGFPGAGRLLYRWESSNLTDTDWTPKGIFRTTSAELNQVEGRIQAPHCIVDGGEWWMFYNSNGAFVFASGDGKVFRDATARDGSPVFFEMGRDVMMFDNRERDGLWYAFFTDITPGRNTARKSNSISFRTARDLRGPWSEKKTEIGVTTPPRGPDDPYSIAEAESPFVVFRNGWYLRWEQMWVYASKDLSAWDGPPAAKLTPDQRAYLAPEIVVAPDGHYIAAYREYGREGIWIAKLAWEE